VLLKLKGCPFFPVLHGLYSYVQMLSLQNDVLFGCVCCNNIETVIGMRGPRVEFALK
jgi:hypothetical protein